jgi:hypothetical protein
MKKTSGLKSRDTVPLPVTNRYGHLDTSICGLGSFRLDLDLNLKIRIRYPDPIQG